MSVRVWIAGKTDKLQPIKRWRENQISEEKKEDSRSWDTLPITKKDHPTDHSRSEVEGQEEGEGKEELQ